MFLVLSEISQKKKTMISLICEMQNNWMRKCNALKGNAQITFDHMLKEERDGEERNQGEKKEENKKREVMGEEKSGLQLYW